MTGSEGTPNTQDGPALVIAQALAGDEIDVHDRKGAAESPDEWCAECLPRSAAAVNAARIALEALDAAGYAVVRKETDRG